MAITEKKERIFVDAVLVVCIFLVPSYISLLLGSLFMVRYSKYIEFPLMALLIDVLYKPYGSASIGLFGWALLLLFIVEYFRERVKLKGKDTL